MNKKKMGLIGVLVGVGIHNIVSRRIIVAIVLIIIATIIYFFRKDEKQN